MTVSTEVKSEKRTYYVVFQKSFYDRPWHILCQNGYEHVWVFYPKFLGPPGLLTHQRTIKIEPLATFLDTDYWNADPESIAQEFIKEDYIKDIVKIVLPLRRSVHYNIRGIINCVTIIKFVIGLTKWFVFTPQQLRRCLLRMGGRSMKNGRCS